MHHPCEQQSCAKHGRLKVAAAITGFASLVWFLVRVVPKPSRAAYPCQRAAAPLASGFVLWLAGLLSMKALYSRALRLAGRSRVALAAAGLLLAAMALWLPLATTFDAVAQMGQGTQHFTPSEPPNTPMGAGKGIFPGRVVWDRDASAAKWDGKTGNWWDDANNDQEAVNGMMSRSLQSLTGQKTDKAAWQSLFSFFNETHGGGKAGYKPGEKIAIKVNGNQDRRTWGPSIGTHSPHMVYALVSQLIEKAGVRGEDITLYEACTGRWVGDPIYNKIRANPNPNFKAVKYVSGPGKGINGRVLAEPDMNAPIHFADPDLPVAYPPKTVTEAKYLINFALLRAHGLFGVTLTAKNHFGSVYFPNDGGWIPRVLHSTGDRDRDMGSYACLVDLIGYKHFGGKTLLYLLDGLYTAEHNEGYVYRWASFGNQWASSLLVSQDPIAIDSVGLDLLRNEPRATQVRGNPDNYLHEAALAPKPPSGTVYDPNGDGKPLTSCGVHEHWNDAKDKQYSRNLGKKEGIELIAITKP
ncbi:MAG: DUF362 domain-containing protein [Acidobacteria bacterium]|nr:DUF362 domain-containing protein [Acidobacteriota bacterium]